MSAGPAPPYQRVEEQLVRPVNLGSVLGPDPDENDPPRPDRLLWHAACSPAWEASARKRACHSFTTMRESSKDSDGVRTRDMVFRRKG